MSQFITHPVYGRVLSFDGLIHNDKRTHCNYCGEPIDKNDYVKTYGFCPKHHQWLVEDTIEKTTGKNRLQEIIDFRMEEAGIKIRKK